MTSFQNLPQGDVEEDPSLHSGRVLPARLPPLNGSFLLMSKHQLWLLYFWTCTMDSTCSKHLTLKFSNCTFSSQLFGEQIMTQNLFPRPSLLRHSLWYEFDSTIRASCSVSACFSSNAVEQRNQVLEFAPGYKAFQINVPFWLQLSIL